MKLFICKKSIILIIALVLAAGAALGIFAGVAATSAHGRERTIVIDAGHGGVDAGVTGKVTGTKESEINLKISNYLRGYFSDAGFNVVMTRTSQGGLKARPRN